VSYVTYFCDLETIDFTAFCLKRQLYQSATCNTLPVCYCIHRDS